MHLYTNYDGLVKKTQFILHIIKPIKVLKINKITGYLLLTILQFG